MKQYNEPLISVLILSYNHCNYLEKAIQSAMSQTRFDGQIEVLVLDDGSSDGSQELLKRLEASINGLTCFYNEHGGITKISTNFNFLVSKARGKYIAFLASDDEYLPNRFDEQVTILEEKLEVQLIYSNGLNIKNGKIIGRVTESKSLEVIKSNDPFLVYNFITKNIPHLYIQSILVRKSFFKDFLPFDQDLIADDWVFNIRSFDKILKENESYIYLDKDVFLRNVLEGSTSNNFDHHSKRIQGVLDKYFSSEDKDSVLANLYFKQVKKEIKHLRFKKACTFFIMFLFRSPYFIRLHKLLGE